MRMGQTKKKVILAIVVTFLITAIAGAIFFVNYKKGVDEEMAMLREKGRTVERYILNKSLAEGDIITPEDLVIAEVKAESVPIDSFNGDVGSSTTYLSKITNRRLIIDAEENTIITESMLWPEADAEPALDERLQEFNMITLPSDLDVGDYVDLRITFPNAEDYIVISGKEIKSLGSTVDTNTIFLQLDEEEILRSTAAIIESFMTNGSEIYVNKYVKPTTQLYDSKRVDLVAKYQETVEKLIEEKKALASGDSSDVINSGDNNSQISNSGETSLTSGITSLFGDTSNEIVEPTIDEIVIASGIEKEYVENIKVALENNDEKTLNIYKNWLVKDELSMVNNYPVKSNIAELIVSNPNILKDIESKYNVAELEAQRANIIDKPLYEIDEYTGTITETEAIEKIEEELTKKIETQKVERKEYLQALLLEQSKK